MNVIQGPLNCKGVQVKLFGGDGQGSIAEPIIGALVGDAFAGKQNLIE